MSEPNKSSNIPTKASISLPKGKMDLSLLKPKENKVTSTLGPERLVVQAKGQDLTKVLDGTIANSMTYFYFDNIGKKKFLESTLGNKFRTTEGWRTYIQTVKEINNLLKNIGNNNAMVRDVESKEPEKEKEKDDVKSVEELEKEEMREIRKRNNSEREDVQVEVEEGKGGILFLKDLTEDQKQYIVGYETYVGNGASKGMNQRLWDKYEDKRIIELVKHGATVIWDGPTSGQLAGKELVFLPSGTTPTSKTDGSITFSPTGSSISVVFNKDEAIVDSKEGGLSLDTFSQLIENRAFSFHQVYVPGNIELVNLMRQLSDKLQEALRLSKQMDVEINSDSMTDDLKEIRINDKTKITLNELFPKNPKGKFIETEILERDAVQSISEIGTGLLTLRKKGGFNEKYLGVEAIEDVLNRVLGKNNYTFITGTLTRIYIPNKIVLPGERVQLYGMTIPTAGTEYEPGDIYLMRGVYIDRLGNFKIAQISTNIKIGEADNEQTKEATAEQLVKRKLITMLFPLFRSIGKGDIDAVEEQKKVLTIALGNSIRAEMIERNMGLEDVIKERRLNIKRQKELLIEAPEAKRPRAKVEEIEEEDKKLKEMIPKMIEADKEKNTLVLPDTVKVSEPIVRNIEKPMEEIK